MASTEAPSRHGFPKNSHRSQRASTSTNGGQASWDSRNQAPPFIRRSEKSVEADTLNTLVTGAIWRAEQLEAHGMRFASQAWAEVSSLEENLAKLRPASDSEGRIARRGAVRAALKAGDHARARALAEDYVKKAAPTPLKKALREMLEEDDRAMASRFRYASKYYSPQQARDVAHHFQESGAFGLAA